MSPERDDLLRQVALMDLADISDSVTRLREIVENGVMDDDLFSGIRDVRKKIIGI
jgi:hypothetical protein